MKYTLLLTALMLAPLAALHAAELKINPGRIATWGFSAGGWLSSSAGCSTADDSRTIHLSKTQDSDPEKRKGPKFLFPMDDARGEWLDQSSRVSAIAADLWENTEEFFSPDDRSHSHSELS